MHRSRVGRLYSSAAETKKVVGSRKGFAMVFWWGQHMGGWGYPRRPTAEDVLAERFARGEIDEQEYRSRISVLRGELQRTSGRRR